MFTLTEIRKIANLNHKKVTIIKPIILDKLIILQIRWKYTTTTCPHCGLKTSKRKDKKLHRQNRLVPHMPYGLDKMI